MAWNVLSRKARSPLKEAGFLLRVFSRERRYAEPGYLLPFYFRLAEKTRCIGPSYLTRPLNTT